VFPVQLSRRLLFYVSSMKKIFFLILLASIPLLFSACGKTLPSQIVPINSWSSISWTTIWTIDRSDFTGSLHTVLLALKNQDFAILKQFVWPQGLRFSPYEYINTETDVILDTQIVENAATISRSYVWWLSDGKWDPIDLWIGQYFENFVNDADYQNAPEVLYNQSSQRGNTTNNIAQVYTWKSWVEFYFSWFNPQYEGMDRKSLTLVFEKTNGQWYLIWVVHAAWTI